MAAVRDFRRVGRLTIGLQVANVANLPHNRAKTTDGVKCYLPAQIQK